MVDFATLRLVADSTGLKPGVTELDRLTAAGGKAEKATDRFGREFKRTGGEAATAGTKIKGAAAATDKMHTAAVRAAKQLVAMTTAFVGIRSIGGASEQYNKIANSMRAMGVDAGHVAGSIQAIADISNRTRAPLEATAQLYQRISIAGKDLGASQQSVMRFTENVGLALAQTGASSGEAAGALLQLSQAMSGGTVRAEEFNSILEGAFPIAQAAANAIDGAAGSVGRLRQMVIAGEISSKEFFDAIISQTTELEAAFANTIPTVSQAFTVLGNNFTLFIGQMDGAYGASGAVAKAIIALAENIDRVAIYAGTAALAIGGAYVTSAAIAAASTLTFAGALTFLRAAIMRIGIGLFVVAIGEGVYWFNKLVTATGGWGFALQALGDLAAGVWEGIKTSASSIGPSLNAVWETVKSGFYSMLAGLTEMWSGFLGSMAGGLAGIPGFGGISDSLSAASANAFGSMSEYTAKAQAATSANERLTASAAALREQGWDRVNAALKTLQLQMDGANGELDEGTKASDKLKDALGEVNNALGEKGVAGGAGKAEEAVKDLKTEMEGPLSGAIDNLGNAFGEFLTGGIRSFKDFAKSIIDGFKRMISQMIATSIANPIKLALGLSVGGGAGTSAAAGGVAAGGAGGGGGILGGLLGGKVFGAGGVIGGLFKGFTTGITNMFGGFGTMFSGIGSQLGLAATGSMSAIAGAIGMIAAPLLAVAAVFSFFKTKTTELDAGLRVTVTGMDALIETFSTIEKKKFWGLSKKVSTGYSPADDAVADPLIRAVADIQGGVLVAAKTMGIGSDAFTKFSHTLQVSTKGLSEEDAQKAVEDAFGDLGNAFADMIPGLQRYTQAGEESLAAVTRLSAALVTANDAFDLLGRNLYAATLAGADMASGLVDAFGGLDAMTSAVGTYWEAFYSEAERSDTIMRRLRDQFADLNVVMPESRAEYRKIVDAIDTTTEAGRELFAGMVSLAGAMDAVLPQVASFTAAMQGIVDRIGGEIGVQIDQATQMAADYKASASLWYKAATTIRDFLRDLNNSPLALGSASQQFATNKGRFDTAFSMVKGGDLQAAQDMPALAKAYLESIQATSGSAVDYRRQAAQVTAALQLAGGISDVEGSNDDILRGLYQQQIDVLTSLANFLQLDGIDADLLKTFDAETQELIKNFDGTVGLFDTTLKQISDAITSAKDFSYDKIMADLDIAINLGKGSKLPAWVKDLVTGAGGNIKTTFDFILRRDDLTPDMKWIATQSISDMTKNLKFIVTKGLDEATAALALMVTSSLTKTIKFIVRSPLDDETKRLALIGNSNLVRTVKAVLSSNADPDAMILALAATGAYDVAVRAALDPSVTKNVRQLVFGDTGTFEAVVTAALSLDKAARRILLTQAGEYAVNITATLVSGLDKPIQKLLLNANTMAIRAVTIAAAFADGMDPELVTLLAEDGSRAIRTIKAVVNPGGIDALGLLFLDQLIQTAPVERSITASVGAMSAGNRRVLFEQKGAYAVDISASLGAGVKGSIKPLLFDKPTAGIRDIGITGGFGDALAGKFKRLLSGDTASTRDIGIVGGFDDSLSGKFKTLLSGNSTGTRDIGIAGAFDDDLAGKFKTLLSGNSAGTRDIGIVGDFDDGLAGKFKTLLTFGATSATRNIGITGGFNDDLAGKFQRLLSGNTNGRRDIGVAGAFTDDLAGKFKTLLSGNSTGTRDIGITGGFDDDLAGKFQRLIGLSVTSGSRDIGISGAFSAEIPPALVRLLESGRTSGRRDISISGGFDEGLSGNLERLLGLGKTAGRRDIGITGAFTDETDLKFRKLLSANTAARRDIGIAGAFTDMPDKIKTLLGAAFTTGTRKVGITSSFDPAMSAFMVDLLSKDTTGARDIGITGAIDASPAMRRLLSMDTTTATRGITATLDDDGISPLGQRFLTQLAAVGDVSRGIAGSLTVAAMDKTGGQFWRQLMSGVTTTAKTISGLVSVLPMTDDAGQFWQRLLAGASTTRQNIAGKLSVFGMGEVEAGYFGLLTGGFKSVPRGIAGKLSVDRMTPIESSYFGLLTNAFTAPTRGINGKLTVYKMGAVEADYWTLLTGAFTAPVRGIAGKLTVDAMTGTIGDFWRELLAGSSTVAKTIAGGITGVTQATGLSWVADKFLQQIIAGDGIFTKTIMGGVNLDGLDARQLALLDAIRGANAGLLTIGGSFKFAPEAAFSTWFGDTLKTGITTPMSVLSLALGDLRKAVADQIAAEKGREVASALTNAAAGTLTGPMGANILGKDKIEELARIAGINIADHNAKGGTLQGLADRVAGFSAYDSIKAIVADPTGDRTKALLFEHLTDPGLMVNPGEYKKHVIPEWASKPQMHFEQIGLQQLLDGTRAFRPETFNWKTIGLNVPGFADGGIHAGGLRMVGERGPELEYTGPSRITSNSDMRSMLDNRELLAEIRALRKEFAGARDDAAEANRIKVNKLRIIADLEEKADKIGAPPERAVL